MGNLIKFSKHWAGIVLDPGRCKYVNKAWFLPSWSTMRSFYLLSCLFKIFIWGRTHTHTHKYSTHILNIICSYNSYPGHCLTLPAPTKHLHALLSVSSPKVSASLTSSLVDRFLPILVCHKNEFLVAQMVKNPPAMWETWVWSLVWDDPLEGDMATHSSIPAWRIPMDRGAWWATVRGAAKSQTRLSN